MYDQFEEPKAPVVVAPAAEPVVKADKFCRMTKVHVPNSHWPAYQAEVIYIQGDKIVKREFVGKPDMFENVYAHAADQIDPRND